MENISLTENATLGLNASQLNATSTMDKSVGGLMMSSVGLFLMAIVPIYYGSLRSAVRHAKQRNKQKGANEEVDTLTTRDAALFPLIASGVLFSLFIIYKIFPLVYINILLRAYFSVVGVISVFHMLKPVVRPYVPSSFPNARYTFEYTRQMERRNENETEWCIEERANFELERRDLFSLVIAAAIGLWYSLTQHWIANNCFGISFALIALEMLQLNKFINGCILLGGLFIYDIFWVFGTTVMVSVAKSFDAPIKVVFPRDFLLNGVFGKEMSMLGLGDIVVPGIYVAMLLRFDISLNRQGSRAYFHTGYVAYIVGLFITFIVMHVFKHAQPALLYLVPACVGAPLFLALVRGDLRSMFNYVDVPDTETNVKEASTALKIDGSDRPDVSTPTTIAEKKTI